MVQLFRRHLGSIIGAIVGTAAIFCTASTARADVLLTYSSSGRPLETGIGDTINSGFDTILFSGVTNNTATLVNGVPQNLTIDSLAFGVNINAIVPALGSPESADQTLTIDGVTNAIGQQFQVDISYSDTLTVWNGNPVHFSLPGGGTVLVTPLGFGPVTDPASNSPYIYDVNATFLYTAPVPEPTSLALFTLVVVSGGLAWRRRRLGV